MRVDRLGALESVVTAAWRAVEQRPDHSKHMTALYDALAALDAASPLTERVSTTPTPDQGALERARAALWQHLYALVDTTIYDAVLANVAAALTAAASEARAAAIAECAQWIRGARGGWPTGAGDSDEWTLDDVANELERALTTPAQSETR